MGSSGFFGGRVLNRSTTELIVAYNDPEKPLQWRHTLLTPGSSSPATLDVDGFRALDPGMAIMLSQLIAANISWAGWWRIRDWTTANVSDNAPGLKFSIDTGVPGRREPETKKDSDFDYEPGKTGLQPFP